MKIAKSLESIVNHFIPGLKNWSIEPFGNGHINDTYLVKQKDGLGKLYLLQRINHQVFPEVSQLMNNIDKVTHHIKRILEKKEETDINRKVLLFHKTVSGKSWQKDQEGNFWRLCNFISDSHCFDRVDNPNIAYEGGKAFGQFQNWLQDLPASELHETIPDFHHMPKRLNKFHQVVKDNPAGRLEEVQREVDFVHTHAEKMCRIQKSKDEGKLPIRITHNDTKINNVLFDEKGEPLCVIDLDTVMPGLVLFDFGDSIRTVCNTHEEDERDWQKVGFNMTYFTHFSRGFLEMTHTYLTEKEINYLPLSAQMMTFIMGLRFLTDYLEGDVYYKIGYPDQNICRARTQFALVQAMERQEREMEEVIGGLVASSR